VPSGVTRCRQAVSGDSSSPAGREASPQGRRAAGAASQCSAPTCSGAGTVEPAPSGAAVRVRAQRPRVLHRSYRRAPRLGAGARAPSAARLDGPHSAPVSRSGHQHAPAPSRSKRRRVWATGAQCCCGRSAHAEPVVAVSYRRVPTQLRGPTDPTRRRFRAVGANMFRRRDWQPGAQWCCSGSARSAPEGSPPFHRRTSHLAPGARPHSAAPLDGPHSAVPLDGPHSAVPLDGPHSAPVPCSRRQHVPVPRPANRRREVRQCESAPSAREFSTVPTGAPPLGADARPTQPRGSKDPTRRRFPAVGANMFRRRVQQTGAQ